MNIVKLKEILVSHNLFVDEKRKNIISCCIYCKDHKDKRKRGHLYVSTNPDVPKAHCFLCGKAVLISTLIKDITNSDKIVSEVISEEEIKNATKQQHSSAKKETLLKYKLPVIDTESFFTKRLYVKQRTCNLIEPENIPNLIFDFENFFSMNRISPVENGILENKEYEYICRNFVGFLSRNYSTIYCRNINGDSLFKFRKIMLQKSDGLLDYWCIHGPSTSSTVVLSEGNFNILSEFCSDNLKIKENVRVYASGNSFVYSSLLKSLCYDEDLYKCDVIILSDDDKKIFDYYKFKNENSHIINSLQIWGNESGKDFGEFPVKPFLYKELKNDILNKIKK